MFVLLALSMMYVRFGNLPLVAAMFKWFEAHCHRPGGVALHRVAWTTLAGPIEGSVASRRVYRDVLFQGSLLTVMLSTLVLGILLGKLWPHLFHRPSDVIEKDDEEGYCISPSMRCRRNLRPS